MNKSERIPREIAPLVGTNMEGRRSLGKRQVVRHGHGKGQGGPFSTWNAAVNHEDDGEIRSLMIDVWGAQLQCRKEE